MANQAAKQEQVSFKVQFFYSTGRTFAKQIEDKLNNKTLYESAKFSREQLGKEIWFSNDYDYTSLQNGERYQFEGFFVAMRDNLLFFPTRIKTDTGKTVYVNKKEGRFK